MRVLWVTLSVCLLLCCHLGHAFFDWMRKAPPPAPPTPAQHTPVGETPVFEMSVVDEKFLAEARVMDLSPLDTCHYKVVSQLKSTCNSLSEEELAKLGVLLFNCQAEVEGRPTYPCTPDMTLKECTADMDADTWNAYHIVSNRARSVCYATRQQHFRKKAEHTVNALIATATSQLDAMKDLKEGQRELKDLTAASLEKLLVGHDALQEQQGALREGQDQLESSISTNLQQLSQEKALIASGQELVAQLITVITQRMENVSEELKDQSTELQLGHKTILEDLAAVRGRAQDIYTRMENNLSGFLRQQNRTAQFYSELMVKLEKMNGTLGFMLQYLDSMQRRLEERLQLIQGYLGWAGLSLSALWVCVIHTVYFLLAAVLLSFLQCPRFSRAALLVTVPLNAAAQLHQQPALDMSSLSVLLVSLTLGRWFLLQLLCGVTRLSIRTRPLSLPSSHPEPNAQPRSPKPPRLTHSTPQRDAGESGVLLEQDSFVFDEPSITAPMHSHGKVYESRLPSVNSPNHSTPRAKGRPSLAGVLLDSLPQRHLGATLAAAELSYTASPNQSLTSNSSASGRRFCLGTTKTGQACKKRAALGQDYCRIHEGGQSTLNPP